MFPVQEVSFGQYQVMYNGTYRLRPGYARTFSTVAQHSCSTSNTSIITCQIVATKLLNKGWKMRKKSHIDVSPVRTEMTCCGQIRRHVLRRSYLLRLRNYRWQGTASRKAAKGRTIASWWALFVEVKLQATLVALVANCGQTSLPV